MAALTNLAVFQRYFYLKSLLKNILLLMLKQLYIFSYKKMKWYCNYLNNLKIVKSIGFIKMNICIIHM